MRARDTTSYMKERFQKKKEAKEGRSCIAKCGSLLKTLFVYGIVALFLIPIIYETYNKIVHG